MSDMEYSNNKHTKCVEFSGDYHLHTHASDGRASVLRHVRAAKARGLKEIAITDHSFSTFMFHMTERKFARQREKIADFADCGVNVLHGVEGNIIGDKIDVPHSCVRKCDVLLVGFHRFINPRKTGGHGRWLFVNGFGGEKSKEKLVYKNTEAYLSVMENYPIDVLAHIGHRVPVDFVKVFECAARHNVYIELNAKHLDALEDYIEAALAAGVKFIVGSDAHSAKSTGKFDGVAEFIKKHEIPVDRVYGIEGNPPVFKSKKEWKYGDDV